VVPIAEMPETWGLIEVRESTAAIAKPAPDLPAVPPDMLLICSILRSAADCSVPAATVQQRISAGIEAARSTWERQHQDSRDRLKRAVEEFEKASGIEISDPWYSRDIGKAVKFVRETGVMSAVETVRDLRDQAKRIAERLDEALKKLEKPQQDETPQ